jgi:hypothetical protein
MAFNPEFYIKKGIGANYTQFARLFYDLVNVDVLFRANLISAKIPGLETYQKAGSSANVGRAIGAVVGIGWDSSTTGIMSFADHPIREISITENSGWAPIYATFPLRRPPPPPKRGWFYTDSEQAYLKMKKTGLVAKKREDFNFESFSKTFPCANFIREDKTLMDELFIVAKTPLMAEVEDWGNAVLRFGICEAESKEFIGYIETSLNRTVSNQYLISNYGIDLVQAATVLLHSYFRIAQHLNNAYPLFPMPPPPPSWEPSQQKQTSGFCPHCRRMLEENSRFCGQCGKPM